MFAVSMKAGGESVNRCEKLNTDKIDELIVALSEHIINIAEQNKSAQLSLNVNDGIADKTKALAELLTARALF